MNMASNRIFAELFPTKPDFSTNIIEENRDYVLHKHAASYQWK